MRRLRVDFAAPTVPQTQPLLAVCGLGARWRRLKNVLVLPRMCLPGVMGSPNGIVKLFHWLAFSDRAVGRQDQCHTTSVFSGTQYLWEVAGISREIN